MPKEAEALEAALDAVGAAQDVKTVALMAALAERGYIIVFDPAAIKAEDDIMAAVASTLGTLGMQRS